MRLTHFAPKVLISALLGTTVAVPAAAPAYALSTTPRNAPLFNGSVHAIAYRGTTVYVGGSFTTAVSRGRIYHRRRLAAFDSRTGLLLNWHPAADGTVRTLAVAGRSVFAAGDFGEVAGKRRDSLVRLGAVDGRVADWAHGISGTAYRLAVGNGRLYLGGRFSAVDGTPRTNLAAFDLGTGKVDELWAPVTDVAVHALAFVGRRIYVGGLFNRVDDYPGTYRIAALDSRTGRVDPGFLPRPAARVNSIVVDHSGVYVATGGKGGKVIAYTRDGRVRWQRVFDGDVSSVVILDGVIYAGGHFDAACLTNRNGIHGACADGSVPRVKLAAVAGDTGRLIGWAPQANGVVGVRAMGVDPARTAISVGGDFTEVAGRNADRFALFD